MASILRDAPRPPRGRSRPPLDHASHAPGCSTGPTYGSGHVFAHSIAKGEMHPIAAPFSMDRFYTGALIDEAAAAAVAH